VDRHLWVRCRDVVSSFVVVQIQMANSLEYQPVECAVVVNATGAHSAKLLDMMGIGTGAKDTLSGLSIPVEPRKRFGKDLLWPIVNRLHTVAFVACDGHSKHYTVL